MFVNLDIETLKAISREIDSTNSTLVGSLYPQVRNALVSINENIIEDEIKIIEKFSIFDIELEKTLVYLQIFIYSFWMLIYP